MGVIGAGNVGSALVMDLAAHKPLAADIEIASRNPDHAFAAILDAASAYPETAAHFSHSGKLTGKYDVVVVTAGEQPRSETSPEDLLERNLQIVENSLSEVEAKIIILIGTPVDILTEKFSHREGHGARQIVGFGGELDRSRLRWTLSKSGISQEEVYVIGEHGPRAIPVYTREEGYESVKREVTTFLKTIKLAAGVARNLATGAQLARLLRAISGEEQIMCVSTPSSQFNGLSITWPYTVNEHGIGKAIDLPDLGEHAKRDLEQLLNDRGFSS